MEREEGIETEIGSGMNHTPVGRQLEKSPLPFHLGKLSLPWWLRIWFLNDIESLTKVQQNPGGAGRSNLGRSFGAQAYSIVLSATPAVFCSPLNGKWPRMMTVAKEQTPRTVKAIQLFFLKTKVVYIVVKRNMKIYFSTRLASKVEYRTSHLLLLPIKEGG